MYPSLVEVAIIGAGPNGLGLAAHLRQRGVAHRIFGSPMQTWRDMPKGMSLKSLGFATSIPTPAGQTFPEYCRAHGLEDYEPIEFATFAEYGLSIQREFVPHVENTRVTDLQSSSDQFVLTLESGERVWAKRVVVAVGLTYFARIPEVLARLPAERVKHTWGHTDFESYAGKDVVVIGGGSSALETAALLHEHRARVQVLVRGSQVNWGGHGPREWERTLIDRIKMPISSIGHGRENWVLQHIPWLMHFLPATRRIPFTRKHLGPAPAWWLRERVDGKLPVRIKTSVLEATLKAEKLALRVREEGVGDYEILADRVIAGTGYEVDIDRIGFINKDLTQRIDCWGAAPRLSRHFESSVPGLYFIGPVAAASFGPLVRFVAGSDFAVNGLARHLGRRPGVVGSLWRRLNTLKIAPVR